MHEVKFSISTCFERSKYGARKLRYVKQKKAQEKLTLILTPCVVACVPRFHILFGSFFTFFERGWLYNFLLNVLRTMYWIQSAPLPCKIWGIYQRVKLRRQFIGGLSVSIVFYELCAFTFPASCTSSVSDLTLKSTSNRIGNLNKLLHLS